jgi:hypothetical protein
VDGRSCTEIVSGRDISRDHRPLNRAVAFSTQQRGFASVLTLTPARQLVNLVLQVQFAHSLDY